MANQIADGSTWLAGQLTDNAGTAVVYYRNQHSVELTGTRLLRNYQVIEESGFATNVQMHDWSFTTADLMLNGSAFAPRPGDYIAIGTGASQQRYEVLPLGDDPAALPADANGIRTVVHSKRVR